MKLDQALPDHELEDWALYWQPDLGSKLPEASQTDAATIKDCQRHYSDSEPIDLSTTTTPSRPPEEQNFLAQPILESHSQSQNRSFAYWPQVLFSLFLFQIGAFAFQFAYFREKGLPIFKNWPIIYAWAAPANTCVYMTSMLKIAPLRWPALAREEYARLGSHVIVAVWVFWTLGVWLEVRTWGEHGAGGGGGGVGGA